MMQIHLTTGDSDGIGLEVSLKALLDFSSLPENVQFILWRKKNIPSFLAPLMDELKKKWKSQTCDHFSLSSQGVQLVDRASDQSPVEWVRSAVGLCLKNSSSMALVTAPLSKTDSFLGHTEYLRSLSKEKLYMCFLGEKFNVVLMTDHIPLKQVLLQKNIFEEGIEQALSFRKFLSADKRNKPVGVLGWNPHAGEGGVLGREESAILKPVLQKFQNQVEGLLVPDTAFLPANWPRYSFYYCLYHDQGLIPFKMIHKQTGVQTTLGLDFVRVSVDHGTAKDIFGMNKANFSSMKKAIETAISLLQF